MSSRTRKMLEMAQAAMYESQTSEDVSSSFESFNDIPEDVRDIVKNINIYSPGGIEKLYMLK